MPKGFSRGLPPGPNVGTQLRARRAAKARAERQARDAAETAQRQAARQSLQLSLPSADGWFAAHGWTPFAFQREVWAQVAAGRSGLLHATTGAGKTYAVWFALLNRALSGEVTGGGLRMLWITPMRALSADTARALEAPLDELGLDWEVGVRTGDTEAAERTRQSKRLPEALVTTPESLSLLLTRADAPQLFAGVQMVVVDEWHELVGSKRGVQVQLALARVQRWARVQSEVARGEAVHADSAPTLTLPRERGRGSSGAVSAAAGDDDVARDMREAGADQPPPQPSPAGGGGSSLPAPALAHRRQRQHVLPPPAADDGAAAGPQLRTSLINGHVRA